MSPSTPFVDRVTGDVDYGQIITEAIPLEKLVGLVTVVALVPFALAFALRDLWILGAIFGLVGQFVLAVGSGLVLIYVVRAIQLAEE